MQSFVRVFALAALSAFLATASFASPPAGGLAKRDTEGGPTHVSTLPLPSSRHLTNAERMARGLPPNPPNRRNGRLVARVSPTPVGANSPAPTQQASGSGSCTQRSGIIEIASVDRSISGYLANVTTRFGQYGFSPNKGDAIEVLAHCDGDRFDLTTVDMSSSYPYFGGITGLQSISADLLPGTSNYAYFGGVTPTLPGKPASSQDSSFTSLTKISNTVESAIWSMDDSTGILTPHWVNGSGDEQTTYIAYSPSVGVLYFTGDLSEFQGAVGESVHEIIFKLVAA
ncbi:uncharacterized protein PHACADRAFT_252417 [Phanerochaete carnosa HHB-10118-sp]|uniref:Uncharacterized protein n=1 Tax=Phanerochaete carnosa (strain HHB-10118-sp) TaxID=650164 RepID=K5WFZ8_PHACS|nr:uncharacterized protein PHACADRAFT_252417 [Phanerochaete carnosa HHB-10118-sp]EKM58240.1 hypothetical protein PHACADRAFT_252417 [Phanerochaete carnosa HHB-10118-sp]